MIVDQIPYAEGYAGLGPRLQSGLRFLKETALAPLPAGKHEIQGDRIYALVSEYQTRPRVEGRWEAHRRYIDIQAVISGEERMGYAPVSGLKAVGEYKAEQDCLWLEGDGDFMIMKPGLFVVFMPRDAHMPGIAVRTPAPVKKIVVKVLVEGVTY